jgi:hypothetical protein
MGYLFPAEVPVFNFRTSCGIIWLTSTTYTMEEHAIARESKKIDSKTYQFAEIAYVHACSFSTACVYPYHRKATSALLILRHMLIFDEGAGDLHALRRLKTAP